MVIAEFPFTILSFIYWLCTCDFHILTLDFTFVNSISWLWILHLHCPYLDIGFLLMISMSWSWWMIYPHDLSDEWHFANFTIYADIALCNFHSWIVTLWSHFTHLVVDTCSWDCSRLILLTIATLQHDDVSLPSFLRMILHITLIIVLTLWLSCWSECAFNALHSTHVTVYFTCLMLSPSTPCISVIALDTWCHSMWVHAFEALYTDLECCIHHGLQIDYLLAMCTLHLAILSSFFESSWSLYSTSILYPWVIDNFMCMVHDTIYYLMIVS